MTRMTHISHFFIAILFALLLSACNNSGTDTLTEDNTSNVQQPSEEINVNQEDNATQTILLEDVNSTHNDAGSDIAQSTPLTVKRVEIQNITKTSVNIHWELNKKATGQIEYGETSNYGTFSKKESSFKYQAHTQHIQGLKAGTTYHYRVISEDQDGNKVVSEDQVFKTELDQDGQLPVIDTPMTVKDHFKDVDIQKQEAKITSKKDFLITTALPLNQQFYISYEIKGKNGANEIVSLVNNSRYDGDGAGPYFAVVSSIGGHDIADPTKWTKLVLPFHLDENLYLKGKRAKEFNTNTVYKDADIIVIAPSEDITVDGDSYLVGGKYSVIFYKDNKYVVKVYKGRRFSSLGDMLNNGSWSLPLEFSYQPFHSKSGTISSIRNIKITKNPYGERIKRTAITLQKPDASKGESGQYSITEHGVLQKDSEPFFPVTIYDSYSDEESTVKRWKEYVKHGIDGILANYVSLPWAYKAGMTYNAMKWGSSGGPVLADQITRPRKNDIDAWNSVYALSYDQESIKYMYHSDKYKDSVKYVKENAASKIRQQLLGNFNQAPFFEEESHLFGTYIKYDAVSNNLYRTTKLRNLEAIDRTSKCFGSIMHINTGMPENRFKAEVMGGIIYGATQLSMWTGRGSGDLHGREGRLEKQLWYDHDILDLKKYINKMLDIGLIGSGLEGNLKVSKPLDYRKLIRAVEVDGVGYLILSNLQNKEIIFNEQYEGLGYTPEGNLVDILTEEVYGHINNDRFEVKIKKYEYRVLKIE